MKATRTKRVTQEINVPLNDAEIREALVAYARANATDGEGASIRIPKDFHAEVVVFGGTSVEATVTFTTPEDAAG